MSNIRMIVLFTFAMALQFAGHAHGQSMPQHVRATLNKIVGNWNCETIVGETKAEWRATVKWSPDESCLVYHWEGTDLLTGEQNSGTGLIGWDAKKQLAVEREFDADGSTFSATHHILANGHWCSPTQGSTVVDGKGVHFESFRVISLKSADEWYVKSTHRLRAGEPVADANTTFRRRR